MKSRYGAVTACDRAAGKTGIEHSACGRTPVALPGVFADEIPDLYAAAGSSSTDPQILTSCRRRSRCVMNYASNRPSRGTVRTTCCCRCEELIRSRHCRSAGQFEFRFQGAPPQDLGTLSVAEADPLIAGDAVRPMVAPPIPDGRRTAACAGGRSSQKKQAKRFCRRRLSALARFDQEIPMRNGNVKRGRTRRRLPAGTALSRSGRDR